VVCVTFIHLYSVVFNSSIIIYLHAHLFVLTLIKHKITLIFLIISKRSEHLRWFVLLMAIIDFTQI